MIKGNILKLLLIFFSALLLNSCISVTQPRLSFSWPVESFVKYETYVYKQTCTPSDPNNLDSNCYQKISGAVGSGSIIAESFDGVYILTAAHMCDRSEDIKNFKEIDRRMGIYSEATKYFDKHSIFNLEQIKYKVEIIGFDHEIDSCIVFAWGFFGKTLSIAKSGPGIGEKIYNFAASAGFFGKNMVPLFDGYYIGDWDEVTSVYTIPVIGGSSGSPIVNESGDLIGLVFARHSNFHHIAISPKFNNLRKFILDTIKIDAKKRSVERELNESRSIIIKFNQKQ